MRAVAAAIGLLVASPSEASVPDVFGLGSEATAQGGAVAASATGFAATHYDPAGLAFGKGDEVSLGWLGYASMLEVRGEASEIAEPQGFLLGMTRGVRFLGRDDGLRFGAAFYVLPDTIVRVLTKFPDDPHYPWFHNRTQRLVVLPGVGVRLTDSLSVGVAANVLAGLDGPARARDGPTRAIETSVAEEIFLRAALGAGIRFDPAPDVSYALAYRQEFFVPYAIQTRNVVGGAALDIDIDAVGLFTPHELVAATSFSPGPWQLGLDFTYLAWARYTKNFVLVESRLPGIGALSPGLPPSPWRDSFDVRLGAERALTLSAADTLFLRTGVAFAPTPILPQSGRTNLLDGDHLVFALGAGIRLGRLLEVPVRLDVHCQWHEVLPRTYVKEVHASSDDPWAIADERPDASSPGIQVSNPGYPEIEAKGRVLSAGLVLTLEVR